MKRRWKVLLTGILMVIVICSGLLIRQMLALQNAECVIRVDFQGLDNMFHVPHEYYAINEKGAVKVPEFLAKQFCGDSVAVKSIYDDSDVNYWWAELEYAEDESCFSRSDYVETVWGDKYRLTYRTWTDSSRLPKEEELQLLQKMAEELHSGNPLEWNVYQDGGKRKELTSFFIVNYQERYMFGQYIKGSEIIYFVTDTGELVKIMSRPENGIIGYDYWF